MSNGIPDIARRQRNAAAIYRSLAASARDRAEAELALAAHYAEKAIECGERACEAFDVAILCALDNPTGDHGGPLAPCCVGAIRAYEADMADEFVYSRDGAICCARCDRRVR